MTTSLEAPLVSDLEERLTSNISNSMSNVSTTFDGIHDSKRSGKEFLSNLFSLSKRCYIIFNILKNYDFFFNRRIRR